MTVFLSITLFIHFSTRKYLLLINLCISYPEKHIMCCFPTNQIFPSSLVCFTQQIFTKLCANIFLVSPEVPLRVPTFKQQTFKFTLWITVRLSLHLMPVLPCGASSQVLVPFQMWEYLYFLSSHKFRCGVNL